MARQPKQEKQPHLAWRITRTVLDVLGKIILVLLIAVGTVALIAAIAGSIFLSKFKSYVELDIIPKAEEYAEGLELDNISLAQTSIIYYTDPKTGEYRELQQLYGTENRIWVSYDDIPLDLVHAAISIEDKRFPTHKGVDWIRTLAAVKGFAGGSSSFGGSTITQQLIKNLSQEDEVTVDRKVQEIFRALEVEKRYTKSEIMEWYLNTIYLGEGCYGVQSASRVYFGKKVSDLTTAECASLIAITNNPSLYDPYIREENNRERQLTILKEMYAQGYIETEEAYQAAVDQEMVFRNGTYDEEEYTCASCGFTGTRAEYTETDGEYFCPQCGEVNNAVDKNHYYSYFVDTVWRDVVDALVERYGYSELAAEQKLLTGGYKIYATIDPEVQAIVDKVYENLDNVPKTVSVQQLQSAIVVTDNKTGDIVAMAGGVGDKGGSLTLNRATQSKQPAGSSFKPVAVYAPALDAGIITPATVYEDSPLNEDRNWPQNDSRSYSGLCNVLRGLTRSLNTISVKVLNDLGVENSYQFLTQKLGFTTLVDELQIGDHSYTDIALAPLGLGQLTRGVTVREMTQAYGTFPNGGTFREARTFTKVVDPEGKVILDNAQESHTAIGEKADFYINYMLQNAVLAGTGSAAAMDNIAVAGKTGTSNDNQTRWFAGYTPYYTAVVWCGYDEPEQIILDGDWTNPAISMWNQVMRPLHEGLESASFSQPENVGYYSVCADCGGKPIEACKKDVRENGSNRVVTVRLFYEDAPTKECTCHTMVKICKESGKIANEYCEKADGKTVEEVGKLIYNKNWKVNKDADFVYNPEDKEQVCTIHTAESVKPTEPTEGPTDPTLPTEPTEPTESTEPPTPARTPMPAARKKTDRS